MKELLDTQQYVYLQTGDSEFGDEFYDPRVVVHFDELPQLVIGLESGQQPAEFVVIVCV